MPLLSVIPAITLVATLQKSTHSPSALIAVGVDSPFAVVVAELAGTDARGELGLERAGVVTVVSEDRDETRVLCRVGRGIELVEHELGPGEGTSLDDRHEQVILVIRDGESMLWNDPRAEPLRPGDRLVEITTAPTTPV